MRMSSIWRLYKSRGAAFLESDVPVSNPQESKVDDVKTLSYRLNALILSRILLQDTEHHSKALDVLKNLIDLHRKKIYLLNDGEHPADISKISLSDFYLRLEFVRLFTKVIETTPGQLDNNLWGSVMVYVSSWFASVSKSRTIIKTSRCDASQQRSGISSMHFNPSSTSTKSRESPSYELLCLKNGGTFSWRMLIGPSWRSGCSMGTYSTLKMIS